MPAQTAQVESKVTVSKSTVESYKVRGLQWGGWADVFIDDNGKRGTISITSDYGDWTYSWSSCGVTFKEFLCQLNISYTAGKFGCSNHFQLDETVKGWKKRVLEARRQEDIDENLARELWGEINEVEYESDGSSKGIEHMLYHSKELLSFLDYSPDFSTTIDPGFKAFWERVWPHVTTAFKAEQKASTPETTAA